MCRLYLNHHSYRGTDRFTCFCLQEYIVSCCFCFGFKCFESICRYILCRTITSKFKERTQWAQFFSLHLLVSSTFIYLFIYLCVQLCKHSNWTVYTYHFVPCGSALTNWSVFRFKFRFLEGILFTILVFYLWRAASSHPEKSTMHAQQSSIRAKGDSAWVFFVLHCHTRSDGTDV